MADVLKPSIGRIVHFVMEDGEHRPALIVRIPTSRGPKGPKFRRNEVNLQVFCDNEQDGYDSPLWRPFVPPHEPDEGEDFRPGTWHWPERVV